jgi:thermitase
MLNRRTLALAVGLWIAATWTPAAAQRAQLPAFVPDELIVAFVPGAAATDVAAAHAQAGGAPLRALDAIGATLVRVPAGNVPVAVAAYERNPNVRYAEPNYLRQLVIPDEGEELPPPNGLGIDYFVEQYGLNNTGQSFYYDELTGEPGAIAGVADADIDATEAWDLHTGSALVKVAVLDTGVDCSHPDLAGKCLENINVGPSATLADEIGHGTHVAGTIAATGNNGMGVAGVSWGAMIGAIKVCYEEYDWLYGTIGLCDSAAMIEGLTHAADSGYQIVNMSFGGPEVSQAEIDAVTYAWSNGVLLVAAAGNNYTQAETFPAALPQVIAVAATDWFDNLAGFSSFGSDWVSLAAPGYYSFNTLPNAMCGLADGDPEGCYGWLSGTSMASPTVAGAAALVWSYLGAGATNADVRSALETTADISGAMGQSMLAWTQHGRLNVHNALSGSVVPPPPPPEDEPGLHLAGLSAQTSSQGPNWSGIVTIRLHDENDLVPANGLTIRGTWTNAPDGTTSCSISAGTCTVTTGNLPKKTGQATFTVTGIEGQTYISSRNHDAAGNSIGGAITLTK